MKTLFYILILYTSLTACNEATTKPSSTNQDSIQKIKLEKEFKSYKNEVTVQFETEFNLLKSLNEDETYPFMAEDSISGIGVIQLSETFDYYKKIIPILDMNGKPYISISLMESGVITKIKEVVYKGDDSLMTFNPRLFNTNPDYFRLSWDCVAKDEKYFTVILNKKTGEKGKLINDKNIFKLLSYEDYWIGYMPLGLDFDRSSNPIRTAPNEDAFIVQHDLQSQYKIWNAKYKEMKGEWIKIQIEETNEIGWIRWKKENKILIRIYYFC
jgi:hypothetical protein